jgi:predicted helicase
MVRFIDEVLREKLHIDAGLIDESVVVLDPAMGTGTFLQSVIDRVAEMVTKDGGDVPASLCDLLNRLIGFERQIGPYAVAELKLEQALEAHNVNARDEDLRLYVADTLDDPSKVPLPRRGRLYGPLAASRRAANHVKTDVNVMVVLGNPPYRTRAIAQGKWVLDKEGRQRSLLDDFREVVSMNTSFMT